VVRRLCLIVLLALGGCNLAVSDHPMFSSAERLATPLKDGPWVADVPDCKFNVDSPKTGWPKCALWTVVSDNKMVDVSGDKDEDRPAGFLIVGGQPPIVQIDMLENGKHGFLFIAIEPTSKPPSGPITTLNIWGVTCGRQNDPVDSRQGVSPFPGFNKECQPQTAAALRAAAVASRPKSGEITRMKWVRKESR